MKYRHALCLYPYLTDQNPGIGIFPPTGLEYVATAIKGHVGRISLVDLRHERSLQPIEKCGEFIATRRGSHRPLFPAAARDSKNVIEFTIHPVFPDPTLVVGGRGAPQRRRCLPPVSECGPIVRAGGEQAMVEIADGNPVKKFWVFRVATTTAQSSTTPIVRSSISKKSRRPIEPFDEADTSPRSEVCDSYPWNSTPSSAREAVPTNANSAPSTSIP